MARPVDDRAARTGEPARKSFLRPRRLVKYDVFPLEEGYPMPKFKTNKAARKRFKITKRGKVLLGKAGRRHLLSVKSAKRRRRLRRRAACCAKDAYTVKKLLGLA